LLLQPCGHVHTSSDGHTLPLIDRFEVHEGLASLDTDANGQSLGGLRPSDSGFSGAQCPDDVIRMGRRGSEQDEDLVTDVFLDRATLCDRDAADVSEGLSETSLHPFGAQPLTEIRGAHDVDEDAGNQTALGSMFQIPAPAGILSV
jgi:hypothetical protein